MNYWVETNSIAWATSLAGCAISNKDLKLSFISDSPLIQYLAESLGGLGRNGIEVKLPTTEDEFSWLDVAQASRLQREMEEIHGIVMNTEIQITPLQYPQLASNLLLHKHGIFCNHGLYFPDPSKLTPKQVRNYSEFTILLESDDLKPIAESYCTGFNHKKTILEPNYLVLSNLEPLNQVMALAALNRPLPGLVVLNATNPLNFILKSWYSDIYQLKTRPAILSIIPENINELDARKTLFWPQQIPCSVTDLPETYEHRGTAWWYRWDCNFDSNQYYIKQAKGDYY